MPIDYSQYPDNWLSEIRPAIQKRAGDRCEWCNVPNHAQVWRIPGSDRWYLDDEVQGMNSSVGESLGLYDSPGPTRIVCTVAHLDTPFPDGTPGNRHNKYDVRPEALAFLCQRCHLLFDLDDHVRNAAATRRRKRVLAGQLALSEELI